MKIAILLLFSTCSAFAWNSGKCSSMLNKGMYKTYKWGGVGDSNANAMTAETKSAGFIMGTSHISTEGSTAVVDTKYSTNVSKSQTQSTSSFGDCSLFGLLEKKQEREMYLAQNLDQIKIDASKGTGPHLEVLAWLSLCEKSANPAFNATVQKNFDQVFLNSSNTGENLDRLVQNSTELKTACYSFSGI